MPRSVVCGVGAATEPAERTWTMFEQTLLSDRDVARLAAAVTTVLSKLGARLQNDELLYALREHGADVEATSQTVRFPAGMVESFVDDLRTAANPSDPEPAPRFVAPGKGRLFHQLSQYYYDCAVHERRPGNRADYVQLLKFGQALHPDEGVGHCLLLTDVPAPVEPLVATLLQFQHVSRPAGAYVQDVRQVPWLEEMEAVSGEQGLAWLANVGFSSPLRLGRDVAERFVFALKRGRPNNVYVMTAAGAGTPVTLAGTVVVAAAEIIALGLAGRAVNPECPLAAGVWIATMDMHTGESSYSAPDAQIRNFVTREFLRRWTGVRPGAGGGCYSPAKTPGPYAALENAYAAMTVAAFTGNHPGVVAGHLDGGRTLCPVQFLLEMELSDAIGRLAPPFDFGEESLAVDTILEVGHTDRGDFLHCNHTLRHFRSALWLPRLLTRVGWTGSEREVLDRAQKQVEELIASAQPPEVDEDKLARLREVVARAEATLC